MDIERSKSVCKTERAGRLVREIEELGSRMSASGYAVTPVIFYRSKARAAGDRSNAESASIPQPLAGMRDHSDAIYIIVLMCRSTLCSAGIWFAGHPARALLTPFWTGWFIDGCARSLMDRDQLSYRRA